MKIDKYWKLRLEKWFSQRIVRWAYKNLPFDISYTNITKTKRYDTNFDFRRVLAEFDIPEVGKHYVIYIK